MLIGVDGGIYVSYDRGRNWDHLNTTAIGQFYHVAISLKEPYWVFGGLQDNGSWGGPAISKSGGIFNEDWIRVGGGDGFVCRVDPNDPDLVYFESQNGAIGWRHLKTGERGSARPAQRGQVAAARAAAARAVSLGRAATASTGTRRSSCRATTRKIFYSAGNYVFRSLDRGNDLRADLAGDHADPPRLGARPCPSRRGIRTCSTPAPTTGTVGHARRRPGVAEHHAEPGPPRSAVDLDDRGFALRRGAGLCLLRRPPLRRRRAVSCSSPTISGRRSARSGRICRGARRASLREDIENQNLLYCGTEFGLWVSLDRGGHWTKLNNNLPTVAVHEVAQHPTNGEIGRGDARPQLVGLRRLGPAAALAAALSRTRSPCSSRPTIRGGRASRPAGRPTAASRAATRRAARSCGMCCRKRRSG